MVTSSEKRAAGARTEAGELIFRKPDGTDGIRVWELLAACPPLDRNSMYCNVLQCTDFSDTCILAEQDGDAVGWISGYRPPEEPSALFIWQVAVHPQARGTGLARRMLLSLINRPDCSDVRHIRTTVTSDNEASRALFHSVARRKNAPIRETAGFNEDRHFCGRHDDERLLVIGPFPVGAARRQDPVSAA